MVKKKEKIEIDAGSRNKINRKNKLFINIQVFLTFLVVVLFIVCLFNRKYMSYVEITLFFALLCMAYNNFKIYKRKFATILYLVVAVLVLVFFIIGLFR